MLPENFQCGLSQARKPHFLGKIRCRGLPSFCHLRNIPQTVLPKINGTDRNRMPINEPIVLERRGFSRFEDTKIWRMVT